MCVIIFLWWGICFDFPRAIISAIGGIVCCAIVVRFVHVCVTTGNRQTDGNFLMKLHRCSGNSTFSSKNSCFVLLNFGIYRCESYKIVAKTMEIFELNRCLSHTRCLAINVMLEWRELCMNCIAHFAMMLQNHNNHAAKMLFYRLWPI